MKTLDTIAGKTYVVSSPNGGTVTSADGLVKETVEAGKQKVIFGTGAPLQLDDDAGQIMATFKLAPAKLMALGLLGGGASTGGGSNLPAGYLAAEFLESVGNKHLNTEVVPGGKIVSAEIMGQMMAAGDNVAFFVGSVKTTNVDECRVGAFMSKNRVKINKGGAMGNACTSALKRYYINRPDGSGVGTEVMLTDPPQVISATNDLPMFMFLSNNSGVYDNSDRSTKRIYSAKIWEGDENVRSYMPYIDPAGKPCMYDLITKRPSYNLGSNDFFVGFTLEQAVKLADLPSSGGALTVYLPTGYEADSGVANALETARSKGWTLTIRTYTPVNAIEGVSTFALRRIWVRRTQDEQGMYADTDGTRYHVDWCVEMYTPDNSTPDQHGYELFRSVDAAVAYWELEPWVDPEAEELLTEQ